MDSVQNEVSLCCRHDLFKIRRDFHKFAFIYLVLFEFIELNSKEVFELATMPKMDEKLVNSRIKAFFRVR